MAGPSGVLSAQGADRLAWEGKTIVTALLIVAALILLNGVFSGAEIAVVSVRRTRVKELMGEGSRAALAVEKLRSNPDRFFATVQIGITVVGATAAALGGSSLAAQVTPTFQRWGLGEFADEAAFAVVVGGISFFSLVIGELVPKSLGLRYAEGYSLFIARPLVGLGRLARPLVWLLTFSSNLVLRFFGDRTSFTEGRMSAEELQQLVEDAAKSGTVDTQTSEIASRAFELKDVNVAAVMVPRSRIVAIDREAGFEALKQTILDSDHSRLPITRGGVEQIEGYIVAKDLLAAMWLKRQATIDDLLRPAYFVPDSMRALDALRELQKRRLQMAIVVDERGLVSGLVTVEDLVEELVGEIVSEKEPDLALAEELADGRFAVGGGTSIRDVNRALNISLPEGEGYTTVAGLCIAEAGRIPEAGETFTLEDGCELEVVDASPRRVRRVAIRKVQPPPEENAEAAEEESGASREARHESEPVQHA